MSISMLKEAAMFGKKKEKQTQPPYQVIVLTRDYMIEGTCDEDNDILNWAATEEFDEYITSEIFAVDVRVQPIGNLATPSSSFAKWFLPNDTNTLAILVMDSVGVDICNEAFEENTHEFPITVYIGPYIVKGTALSTEEEGISTTLQYVFLPVKDVLVTCQLPDAKFNDLRAPMLLVNVALMDGYAIER
jgi:hypothetical protein